VAYCNVTLHATCQYSSSVPVKCRLDCWNSRRCWANNELHEYLAFVYVWRSNPQRSIKRYNLVAYVRIQVACCRRLFSPTSNTLSQTRALAATEYVGIYVILSLRVPPSLRYLMSLLLSLLQCKRRQFGCFLWSRNCANVCRINSKYTDSKYLPGCQQVKRLSPCACRIQAADVNHIRQRRTCEPWSNRPVG